MSAAEKAIAALEAAGKAATTGPLIQDGRFVEVSRDGDFISEHFAQHNITHGDAVAIAQANAALHVAAVNLSSPLAAVARAAMARPWWGHDDDPDPDSEITRLTCAGCESQINEGDRWVHLEPCQLATLDAALDALEAAAEGVTS